MHLIRAPCASTSTVAYAGRSRSRRVRHRPARPRRRGRGLLQGKSVSLVIGYSVGGGYDLYGAPRRPAYRQAHSGPAQHRGAEHDRAPAACAPPTTSIRSAPKDGTAIGTFSRTWASPRCSTSNAQFDSTKFSWLGSVTNEVRPASPGMPRRSRPGNDFLDKPSRSAARAPAPIPTSSRCSTRTCSAPRSSWSPAITAPTTIMLAMERGEVDGLCGCPGARSRPATRNGSRRRRSTSWCRRRSRRSRRSPTCRWRLDLAKDREQLQILKLFLASQEMARPFAAPPGIPADRKAALIAAFDADHEGSGLPRRGAEAQHRRQSARAPQARRKLLAELYATPKDGPRQGRARRMARVKRPDHERR